MMPKHPLIRLGLYAACFAAGGILLLHTKNVTTFLMLTLEMVLLVLAARELTAWGYALAGRTPNLGIFRKILLAGCSVMLCLTLFEGILLIVQHRQKAVSIPPEWARREVQVEGAKSAYYWHGKLHLLDDRGMRRSAPFPPKRDGVFRIMAVGDSLTFGYGVADEEAYPRVIEQELAQTFNVEVLNLGVGGAQSEDILGIIREFMPALRPDLILYGVCMNDFMPHGLGHQKPSRSYAFPMSRRLKEFMGNATLTTKLAERAYHAFLMSVGLRASFYDEILRDLQGYQKRFAKDVTGMSALAKESHLPPIIAMVLDHCPVLGSKGQKIALTAETYLAAAGMDVIKTDEFYRTHD
ncbi:MAG: SGNH/GDSL hydrolase family protein, partial [Planctomycetes bacterium]|nr:SGNH/GDSL hydrolase family protein [Planctomycetota bacterium]